MLLSNSIMVSLSDLELKMVFEALIGPKETSAERYVPIPCISLMHELWRIQGQWLAEKGNSVFPFPLRT